VMAELAGAGARPSQLAARLGVTRAAAGQLVARLEERGLVELVPDPEDGRATIVKPTEAARSAYRAARAAISDIESEWTRVLGRRRMAVLAESLSMLTEWTRSESGGRAR
jgi:DNA-binding MarR family transcriptional regulator